LSAVVAGWESLRRLLEPQPLAHPWVVVAAGVIGFLGNEAVARYRIRVGEEIGSAALVADGVHARTDGFTSLAVVIGALGVMAGMPLADPIVGLLITLAIVVVLRGAAREIYQRLMDAVDPELVATAQNVLLETSGVRGVEIVRLRWVGHRMHAEASVEVDASLSVIDGHYIAVSGHHRLLHAIPKLEDATVHVSPSGEVGAHHHDLIAHHHTGPGEDSDE
jgi:cation diffusion facilitator family transporter